ncbi:MAG: ABC transporter substrate-binding protein [Chloroflexi bacterium]|nr:MAG: ABC transporter substrate-binding protein [Chloroflexota bacterium]
MSQKKYFWLLSMLLVLAMVLAACGGGAADTTEETTTEETTADVTEAEAEPVAEEPVEEMAEPVTIEIFYPVAVDAPIAAILDGYVAEFEAANPNINVEPVFSGGYGDVKTAIQTTIEGGGQPPALGLMLAADLYDLVNSGYIAPLDDYVANTEGGDAMIADFYPAFMANSNFDGQLWGVPFQRSAVLLYYNKDMFADAGLEAPTSWQELADAAQALTIQDGDEASQWGMQWPSGWPYWTFQPLAISSGQNIVGDSDVEVFFDNPDVIDAVQFYIDLAEVYGAMPAGVQGVWGTAPTDFSSGQTAMILHSSGSLPGILEQADFEVGVMAFPNKGGGGYSTVVGGGNLYIMDGAPDEQKAAAWEFIKFLADAERTADFSVQTGYIAARQSAFETDTMQNHIAEVPQAGEARDVLQYAGSEFTVQNLGEVRSIFHDYLQQAYNGELSAAAAMASAQSESDAALDAFR